MQSMSGDWCPWSDTFQKGFHAHLYRYPAAWQNTWPTLFRTAPTSKRSSKHSTHMDLPSLKAKLESLRWKQNGWIGKENSCIFEWWWELPSFLVAKIDSSWLCIVTQSDAVRLVTGSFHCLAHQRNTFSGQSWLHGQETYTFECPQPHA